MKALLLVLSLSLASCGFEYSEGTRTGTLYKLSRKGFVCKTWEGILKTGSIDTDAQGAITSEEFKFSVETSEMVDKLQALEGKKVSLSYVQKKFNPPCSPESQYRIVNVKEI